MALLTVRRTRVWKELEHVSLVRGQVAGRLGRVRLSLAGLAHPQEDPGGQGYGTGDPGRQRDDRVEQLQFGAAAGVEIDDRLHGARRGPQVAVGEHRDGAAGGGVPQGHLLLFVDVEEGPGLRIDIPVPARVAVVCSSSGNLTIWPLT